MKLRESVSRVWWATAAAAIGASMVLAACSGSKTSSGNGLASSETPQEAVQSAVSKLGSQSDMKMVLSLPITADQAKQLSSQNGGKPMSDQEATALTTGTIFLNVATGSGEALDSTQAQSDPNDSVDFGLAIGSNTPLELRYVGQSLYARAQIQQLLTDVGQNPAKASQFSTELSSLNSYVPGISALAQGNWVEINHQGLQSLSGLLKQIESSSGSSANPATLKADLMALRSQLLAALKANSAFGSLGSDKYSVTVNVANFLSTIKPEVNSALSNVPQLGTQISDLLGKAVTKVPPGQTAVIDVTVSGGQLTQASVDLNQFAGKDKVGFPVPLQAAFSSPGAATAPDGATTLDVSKLPGLLGSLIGSTTTTTG